MLAYAIQFRRAAALSTRYSFMQRGCATVLERKDGVVPPAI